VQDAPLGGPLSTPSLRAPSLRIPSLRTPSLEQSPAPRARPGELRGDLGRPTAGRPAVPELFLPSPFLGFTRLSTSLRWPSLAAMAKDAADEPVPDAELSLDGVPLGQAETVAAKSDAENDVIGCYLLRSLNPQVLGRTYIG